MLTGQHVRRFGVACLVAFSLGGCALRDHGAVEYRRADPGLTAIPAEDGNRQGEHDDRYSVPQRPVLLPNQNVLGPAAAPITAQSSITISLDHAFFNNFPEARFTPERAFDEAGPFVRRGEIAILVNAFEFPTEGNRTSGDTRQFDWSPNGINAAHVIYYSDDIEARQSAPFANLPIYGPVEYKGGPIGIDIYMIEIDTTNRQLTALIDSLAAQGAQLSGIPNSALDVLNSIGQSLLQSQSDDIFFRYSLKLDPGENTDATPTPRVVPGRYAFIRNDNRDHAFNWDNLCMDHNTGRLNYLAQHTTATGTCSSERFDEETYVTLTITEGEHVANYDLGLTAFSTLRETLDDEAEAQADDIREAVESVSRVFLADRNFNSIRTSWINARDALRYAASLQTCRANDAPPNLTAAQITAHRAAQRAAQAAASQRATEATHAFHSQMTNLAVARLAAAADQELDAEQVLSNDQVNWLLREIRSAAELPADRYNSVDLASFHPVANRDEGPNDYTATKFSEFHRLLSEAAQDFADRAVGCD